AGLVSVAAPESVARTLHQVVNEGTTLPLPETGAGTIGAEALPVVIERASRFDAVAIGPGMSRDPETVEFIKKAVTEIERPMVIDADAVNALAGEPEALSTRAAATVITPHIRELSRLLDAPAETLEVNRVEAARDAARRTESVVVLKGFRTLVASPSGTVWVIPVGGPVLATGGSGDVLTGIVGTFLASLGPERVDQEAAASAAWAAAWIHGRCGDLQSALRGERGVIAGDLTEVLPEVIRLVQEGA
ncbi:MAG: NAD(P)H-hydrate dehydratase, partial [Actinomycetota bacterium]